MNVIKDLLGEIIRLNDVLSNISKFGSENPGRGYTCAKMAREAITKDTSYIQNEVCKKCDGGQCDICRIDDKKNSDNS